MPLKMRVDAKIAVAESYIKRGAVLRVTRAMALIQKHIIRNMETAKHGRTYIIPGTGRSYTASAPGEYPAVRTGDLIKGLATFVTVEGGKVKGSIGSSAPYSKIVEQMRPWLSRSFLETKSSVTTLMRTGRWTE